jgi:hypothetical protein
MKRKGSPVVRHHASEDTRHDRRRMASRYTDERPCAAPVVPAPTNGPNGGAADSLDEAKRTFKAWSGVYHCFA